MFFIFQNICVFGIIPVLKNYFQNSFNFIFDETIVCVRSRECACACECAGAHECVCLHVCVRIRVCVSVCVRSCVRARACTLYNAL